MRYPSLVVGASVAALVAISVGACAATPTSPSSRETTPAASASVSATSFTAVVESPPASRVRLRHRPRPSRPARRSRAGSRSVSQSRPRWFAADDQSLWVHEPTSLVRVDLATSAITGRFPLDWMEYGYVTTGAGAVWQSDYEHDALLRIDPVAGKVVASIPVGSQPLGVAVTAGVGMGGRRAQWRGHARSIPRPTRSSRRSRSGRSRPNGPQIMTAGPGGVWVDVDNMDEVVRIDAATNKVGLRVPLDGPVASDGKEVWIGVGTGRTGWSVPHRSRLGQGHHRGRPGYRGRHRRPGRRPRIRLGRRRRVDADRRRDGTHRRAPRYSMASAVTSSWRVERSGSRPKVSRMCCGSRRVDPGLSRGQDGTFSCELRPFTMTAERVRTFVRW